MLRRSVAKLACALLLSATGTGQDILDLPWRTDAAGHLEWQRCGPSPLEPPDTWQPLFPGLLDGTQQTLTSLDEHRDTGPLLLLPLLLTGDGGAAAIDDASRRLRKLGILVSFDARAALYVDADPLVDLLRARHLGSLEVAAAYQTLAQWARDTRRDPFVRAAAYAELAARPDAAYYRAGDEVQRSRAARSGPAALLSGLQRLPDDFELLIGVHSAALPTPASLLQAWRRMNVRFASSVVLEAGASLGRAGLWTGQSRIDYLGQLPYELAVRFGNWRVDYALFALRRGDAGWWFHLGGTFDPKHLADGLVRSSFAVTLPGDGSTEATVSGWRLRATTTALEGWQAGVANDGRGAHAPRLLQRAAKDAPTIWLHMPAGSDLAATLHAGLKGLEAHWQHGSRTVTASATCVDPEAAATLAAAWTSWRMAHRCERDDRVDAQRELTWRAVAEADPGVLELGHRTRWIWRRCIQAVTCTVDGNGLRWTCDLSALPLEDLVRLLAVWPLDLLAGG